MRGRRAAQDTLDLAAKVMPFSWEQWGAKVDSYQAINGRKLRSLASARPSAFCQPAAGESLSRPGWSVQPEAGGGRRHRFSGSAGAHRGIYFGQPKGREETGPSILWPIRSEIERIARVAFELAMKRKGRVLPSTRPTSWNIASGERWSSG